MMPFLIRIGILIDFKINQEFIAKVLCVDKEKPMSTCNGKCYLSEQLKKTEEQQRDQVPTSNEKDRYEVVYYSQIEKYHLLISTDGHSEKKISYYRDCFYHYNYFPDVFHPPKFYLV